jgi:MFS family permease
MQAGLAWAILTPWGWRWLVAISSAPLLALMLLYPLLPESPYWLLATGRTPEVVALLQRIAHANGRDLPPGRLQPALSGKSKVGSHLLLLPDTKATSRMSDAPSLLQRIQARQWAGAPSLAPAPAASCKAKV